MNIVWFTFLVHLVFVVAFLVLAFIALWLAVRIMLTAESSDGLRDFWHRFRHFKWESFLPSNLRPVDDLAEVRRVMAEPTLVLVPQGRDEQMAEVMTQALAAEQIHHLEEAGFVIARPERVSA